MKRRRTERRLRAVSIRPKCDLVDRLTRELERSKVPPLVTKQASALIAILFKQRRDSR
jgi:hypothetical protein